MGSNKREKKIVHLIFSFTLGGAENLIVDLVNSQCETAKVCLIVINDLVDHALLLKIKSIVKIVLIKRKVGSKDFSKILLLNFRIILMKPDVVHCHNEKAIQALLFYKNKTVITVHDVKMDVAFFGKYRKVVAISKAVKQDIEERTKNRVIAEVVYNGVNFSLVDAKEDFNLGSDIRIIQVSRLLHEKKGQDVLLEAVSILKRKSKDTIKLFLVGSGSSLEILKTLIVENALENDVFILEDKDRDWVYKNLKSFDILVQPSRFEGFGLTLVEAIAARVPVIASHLDGPKEILADGEYGELFRSGDCNDLADKIEKIMVLYHSEKIKERTQKAFDYATKNFSLHSMLLGYDKIYSDLN